MKRHSILKNTEKQLIELLLFELETMVDEAQFEVDMFPNDQGKVKNILREKNQNIEKQVKQRRQNQWEKFKKGKERGKGNYHWLVQRTF